jgi:DNA repair photolyase
MINYFELRKIISKIIPRRSQLFSDSSKIDAVKEKGRKKNLRQFDLTKNEWVKNERLLNTSEVNSFLEISIRAAACPMPFNIDVWDGLYCPFACSYCFADAFRASLYTAFFDNSKSMGLRHCNPTFYKKELDKLMDYRGNDPHSINNDIKKAIALQIPMRMGIRFEDFTKAEEREGVSLEMLKYLSSIDYPVMLNTKSALVGKDEYVEALSSNKAGSAVHITLITSNAKVLKSIEKAAPTFEERVKAAKVLSDAGVRVVARIEPYLAFITDEKEDVEYYMEECWNAGIRNITFDTYSYSANNPGIKASFVQKGYDFERLFTVGCDSQSLGSLLLDSFMGLFRDYGFSCSTFDIGCAPTNNQNICCEVGDWFKESGFNHGSTVIAARYIIDRGKVPSRWRDFESYVNSKGGFLSERLKRDVHMLWNVQGNHAYAPNWAAGIEPCGQDRDGIVWYYNKKIDHRMDLLEGLL